MKISVVLFSTYGRVIIGYNYYWYCHFWFSAFVLFFLYHIHNISKLETKSKLGKITVILIFFSLFNMC